MQGRKETTLISEIEEMWIKRHGNPMALSADEKFNRHPFRKSLQQKGTPLKPRPERRQNKTGVVEFKNSTIECIAERLTTARNDSIHQKLKSKETFLSNYLAGSRLLGSFQLARGYYPQIVGNWAKVVSKSLIEDHLHQMVNRALNRLLRLRNKNPIKNGGINEGDELLIFIRLRQQKHRTVRKEIL